MIAPTHALHRAWLLAALLLAAGGISAYLAGSARAAQIEHHQVVAGLHGAIVEARIEPEGAATSCQVEYVSDAEFETGDWEAAETVACDPEDLGSGTEPVATSAKIEGLALSTAYRYRFLLTAAGVTTSGGEGEFSTFGIESFSFQSLDSAGEPDAQAGSHPYELIVKIVTPTTEVETSELEGGSVSPTGTIKNLLNELPPGLIGNPTALPSCTVREAEEQKCSGDAQVGLLEVRYGERTDEVAAAAASPLYNVIPPQGKAARFTGFVNASTNAFVDSGVRTGEDYGITSGGFNISGRTNVFGITVRLWGVPADANHDAKRTCPIPDGIIVGCASTADELPFLRNPTSCDGPLTVRARLDSYQSPGEFDEAQVLLPAITGCAQLEFEPTIEVRPTSEVADSPTGLHVDLRVPQNEDLEEPATADLREAVVKLPAGFTLNPSSANGLAACTPAQFGLTTPVGVAPVHTTAGPAACPDGAKIGTVEIDTPLLDHLLPGGVYVAEPYQNPFGSLLAIYVAVDDPESGVVIKLAGHVEIGPAGQLTTTFAENPQLPFDSFKLDFFGGDLAALKTPDICGDYQTNATLTPWSAPESGPPVSLTDTRSVRHAADGGSCPTSAASQPNAPRFEAGSESPLAGAFSPFVVRFSRPDGSQQFSSLTVSPPPGLLGRLAGIPYCPDAALAAAAAKSGTEERESASCPQASQVGSVVVGAGAGAKPYYASGKAYLAGPYKGAPLSLAIVTPAVAGPYDLGDVVVRAALEVNPETAQITVKSDPIPTELKGIPLDLRSIAVKMDRSGFTVNPTNCEDMAVGGSLTTVQGVTVPLSNRFKVDGCRKLGFRPRLSLRLGGATRRDRNPSVRAVLRPRAGQANISRTAVFLPPTQQIDNASIQSPCTRVQFAADACPKGSILGRAKAYSPLLDRPLEGPVYFRSNGGERLLPDLVADLHGQIEIVLVGEVSAVRGRIRTVFATVPDAPVSRFELRISGGKRGWLVNNENLCKEPQRAIVRMRAQNGRQVSSKPIVATACKK
jgi:hypothetical protein